MESQKLSVVEKVGFGAGDMAVNVMVAALFYFMSFFYTDIYGLDPVDMGVLFLVARFVDAFTDPLMGVITDKVKTRWGQFRHWFLFLSVPYGLSVILLFTTPDLDYNMKLAWAYATYLFATLMFTGVAIPYISYIGVLTADPKERLSANGYRMFFAKIANVVIVFSVPLLASYWGNGSLSYGYKLAMALVSACAVALFLFCFFTTRERITHEPQTEGVLTQLKVLLKNDQWLLLCAACVLGTLGYAIRGSVAMYYATYYLGVPDLAGAFTSAGIAASIVSMVASTWITQRYCKMKLFRQSQIAVLFISLLMYFVVQPGDVMMAFVLYIILSFVVDLHAPVFWSAIAEAVDYGEIKDGVRASGLSFGGISFCQKAGGGLAGLAGGLLLAFFEYKPNVEQTEFTLMGLALMLTIIPGVFHALLGLILKKYKITDQYYTDMVIQKRLPK
ncbi:MULTISPECIES: MFS transporter [Pseudoalteromonas]|jgi:GPH family glycoside/pentoside/hexuronide:cation symporter|uniref:Glycoside/pentoside/hexuronide:cation symporter, GPH family n=1 Tax=Pseudoalteromonas lipolytica TaxID=570156 RepID=A0AAD0S394_9GAMM|nr:MULTISPECIES: MFS transporter [Pseudoalteromonas]AXV66734.1 MFS transporter [Pseudoalteromonas donghaensis]MBE0349338.1 glycoside/pentoside/hexuronide:cation symporter, GPH family [Pseudoalteromonas lipolytica LMEB 39]MCC9661182.1 MFS transporter [Pseudoalteromonas sp. MB41]QMW14492.1 MFS transporter [Pseudoalteromonas sp. MT33b]SFT90207.1 glycoside/pentoside/hexuronide:cation symporter, GPH family [Pseudoalteromonas lipolytica]|tara:strand:+ start:8346 stop:9683 length:1338 start_codon:yes stop_codon:yes gene_type:complete